MFEAQTYRLFGENRRLKNLEISDRNFRSCDDALTYSCPSRPFCSVRFALPFLARRDKFAKRGRLISSSPSRHHHHHWSPSLHPYIWWREPVRQTNSAVSVIHHRALTNITGRYIKWSCRCIAFRLSDEKRDRCKPPGDSVGCFLGNAKIPIIVAPFFCGRIWRSRDTIRFVCLRFGSLFDSMARSIWSRRIVSITDGREDIEFCRGSIR